MTVTSTIASDRTLAETLAHSFNEIPIDRHTLPQHRLDLLERSRTSLLRWRGQFSPDLVGLLLDAYAAPHATVLDPFVGSGTTLLECGSRGLEAYGADVNPAATYAARTAELINVPSVKRRSLFASVEGVLRRHLPTNVTVDLFNFTDVSQGEHEPGIPVLLEHLSEFRLDRYRETIFVNALMQAMGDGEQLDSHGLWQAFRKYWLASSRLPFSFAPVQVLEQDARALVGLDKTVDTVITSPPYINVFNYHQNYRGAMERLGCKPLDAARSEIGSNRKHRGNRFYTVVQYCLDMLVALQRIRQAMSADGLAVVVIGRESNVRGQSFENGLALFCLAVGGARLRLLRRHERVFVSRFGTRVYEEILVLVPNTTGEYRGDAFARGTAEYMLQMALIRCPSEIRGDVEDALARSEAISSSPVLGSR